MEALPGVPIIVSQLPGELFSLFVGEALCCLAILLLVLLALWFGSAGIVIAGLAPAGRSRLFPREKVVDAGVKKDSLNGSEFGQRSGTATRFAVLDRSDLRVPLPPMTAADKTRSAIPV